MQIKELLLAKKSSKRRER